MGTSRTAATIHEEDHGDDRGVLVTYAGLTLNVGFGRTPPFKDFEGSVGKGVEKGSIVVDEGPNPVFGSADQNCHVDFRENTATLPPPYNIKIRFRVSNSNAVGGTGGGCG